MSQSGRNDLSQLRTALELDAYSLPHLSKSFACLVCRCNARHRSWNLWRVRVAGKSLL